jgi:pyruvate-formate lyase-activating enzyme
VGPRDKSITDIDQYWQSETLDEIRRALDTGEHLPGCQFCWKDEALGAESMRQRRNRYYEQRPDPAIEHVMVTFGNQCNTACRICNPSRSSLIEKQYKEMLPHVTDPTLHKIVSNLPRFDKTKTWYRGIADSIAARVDEIRKLEVSGGEPFINVYYDRMIDRMVANANLLPQVSVTTNGSFSEEQIEKLTQFSHCHINFSIDGVNDVYDLLRWPLKWDDIKHKILMLKKFPDISCEFVIVPHNLNLLNLESTISVLKCMTDWDPRFKIGFSWLNGAPWYRIDNAPRWAIDETRKDIELLLAITTDFTSVEVSSLQQLIAVLGNSNEPLHVNTLKEHVAMTDRYRGCNTWETIGWHPDQIGDSK